MLQNKLHLPVILFVTLTWLSGSLGGFTDLQVQHATGVIVPHFLTYIKPQFVPIAIRLRPDLNGFAVSTHGLRSDLADLGLEEANQQLAKFVVSIATEDVGSLEYYALRCDEKEVIVLITKTEPVYSYVKVNVTNGPDDSIQVDALPVQGKLALGKEEYYVVLIERRDLATFDWKETTDVTSLKGESNYMVYYRRFKGSPPANALTPSLDEASFTLLVQKSPGKLETITEGTPKRTKLRSISEGATI